MVQVTSQVSWSRMGVLPVGGGALAVAAVLAAPRPGAADPSYNWPQWRGPAGQGISPEQDLPAEWSATENVAWKTPIPGRGHSSPIVWEDRIFLTTAVEGDVVAPGSKGVPHVADGAPFVHPDAVGADRTHRLEVLALDTDTGKVLWERTAWEGTPYDTHHRKGSYASPTPVTDGRDELVTSGTEAVIAYDPATGRERWRSKGLESNAVPSPVRDPDVVVLSAGYPATRSASRSRPRRPSREGASSSAARSTSIAYGGPAYRASCGIIGGA
jgi:hypothetical protein